MHILFILELTRAGDIAIYQKKNGIYFTIIFMRLATVSFFKTEILSNMYIYVRIF